MILPIRSIAQRRRQPEPWAGDPITLLAILFIGLANKIDTGIDIALLTQQTYKIQFFG